MCLNQQYINTLIWKWTGLTREIFLIVISLENTTKKDLEFSVRSGATLEQMAKKYNVSKKTIKRWLKDCGICFQDKSKTKGINSDRHLCRTCMYRMTQSELINAGLRCDYICATGHSRGCSASDCDKYVLGKTKKRKIKEG